MTDTINKKGIRLTLLAISLVQLGSLAISSIISSILESFPEFSQQTAQFLMTFPGIFILITSLMSAVLTRFISQKKLTILGLILNITTAVGGLLLHGNIILLFVWAASFGLGAGLWMPIINALASRYFEGHERASLMGQISSAQNIGAIFMTVVGGSLAVLSWHYVYFVYFIAVPGLVLAVIFLPDAKADTKKHAHPVDTNQPSHKKLNLKDLGIDGRVILFSAIQFFFSLPYNSGPANFSLLLGEQGIGNSSTVGIL